MWTVLLASFVALIPITNPIGALAAFAGLTSGMAEKDVRRQAWRTGICVAAILIVFAVAGTLLLSVFGISLAALQIAGGLVVLHSGYGMLTAQPKLSGEEKEGAISKRDISFSPMALPLVAGPGAIGMVIALSARHTRVDERIGVVLACLAIAVVIAISLRYGTALVEKLGPTGIGALTRVMGFLIAAIGVELALHGVVAFFKL
ncbi:MarC family protein [uncultured Microbacterium sp.]|uniref:MarC family protein n=1 Tax=uncultured Microbacterium sp. TaxID=191216 RepID=UPI0025DC4049|nr:MarC family protein [uncultured Microbacterium sp.]